MTNTPHMPAVPQTERVPAALTIAGSDSSGGAGIQADLKTMTALGVYGASVITALTAQNTTGVQGIHAVPAEFVGAQLKSVLGDLNVRAIKTGMLPTADIIREVATVLAAHPGVPAVVDPVMVATSGDRLIDEAAVATVRDVLAPKAAVLTPNLQEAAVLLDASVAATRDEMADQAVALRQLGAQAVLVKGGHASGDDAADVLADAGGVHWIASEWIETTNTHGTGCTLSAAIASFLTLGHAPRAAVAEAKRYLTSALRSARDQEVGAGHGPVDHMFSLRT